MILLRVVTYFLFIICQILVILKNSKSATKHSSFVEVAITKEDKCIEGVYSKLSEQVVNIDLNFAVLINFIVLLVISGILLVLKFSLSCYCFHV